MKPLIIAFAEIGFWYSCLYRSGTFLKSGTMKLKRPPHRAEFISNTMRRAFVSFGSTRNARRKGRILTSADSINNWTPPSYTIATYVIILP